VNVNAFLMKDAFIRGILFVMELNGVVAALLTGVAIELWGVFLQDLLADDSPKDGLPYVPRVIAFLFHILSCVTVLLQLLNCFLWVGSFLSVSPTFQSISTKCTGP
jgi:hypothetical protein